MGFVVVQKGSSHPIKFSLGEMKEVVMNRSIKFSRTIARFRLFAGDVSPKFFISQFPKRNTQMNAIRFKTILAVCALAGCIAISPSSHAQFQPCLLGDTNLDNFVDIGDVLPFQEILLDGAFQCEADIDGSGFVDFADIAGFAQSIVNSQDGFSSSTATDGIGDFFWSTLNLNEGAVNGPINLSLTPGESAILYLYYSADVPSNREIIRWYSIDLATSQNGIIQFTEAATLNYPISNAGHRWDFPSAGNAEGLVVGQAQTVESDQIIGLTAIGVRNFTGLDVSQALSDEGYDVAANAFLCGRVQIEAIAPGTIELGSRGVIVGEDNILFLAFARANISVVEGVRLGDVNLDGVVDCDDLDGYVGNLDAAVTSELAPLDLNNDGTITLDDANTHITTLVQTSNGRTGTFPGDLNCDGVVNVLGDAFALVGNLGNSVASYSQGDINFDGTVNVLGDAFILIGNLGNTNEL